MLPALLTSVPGPRSLELAARLHEVECHNTTFRSPEWPVFWERAEGVNVWDADGNRYLELTSAFGVATLGHGFTADAARQQSHDLLHAMGDVHPARLKVDLCERLSAITFESWGCGKGKALLGNSGFEAVEAALKTATLATGRKGILAFEGAYHGLGYGALLAAGIPWFREPFDGQLARVTTLLPFPTDESSLESFRAALDAVDGSTIGAVLVEPIQGRGGILIPPPTFLRELRDWCDRTGALLIFDEIFTGLNRTGKRFACDWDGVAPDLVCLGKALSGGFPISACIGKAAIMDAWPETHGEALHTSTFLGNPLGCAMAVAALEQHLQSDTTRAAAEQGEALHAALDTLSGEPFVTAIRGRGLLQAIELHHPDGRPAGDIAISIVQDLLREGLLLLPEGPAGHVLALSPPLGLSGEEIHFVTDRLRQALRRKIK
ncbi:MAG: aspartate aminotransferase family protein [Luteolibacter sp.]